ncbi:MAG: hypothetical protein ACE5GL_07720 [Calditrichia bacterium]
MENKQRFIYPLVLAAIALVISAGSGCANKEAEQTAQVNPARELKAELVYFAIPG